MISIAIPSYLFIVRFSLKLIVVDKTQHIIKHNKLREVEKAEVWKTTTLQ